MRPRDLPLVPVAAMQGLWLRVRATRLPEAAGPRDGISGEGPPLGLLIVGDSSAAGVGVETQDDALAGQLVADLSRDFTVRWRLIAASGATTRTMLARLADTPAERFDIAVTALGINDSKNGMRLGVWRRNYAVLLDLLRQRFGVRRVYVSGVPPLDQFPLLPNPLGGLLGRRSRTFDRALRRLVTDRDARYVDMDLDPAGMASDGFHPGPAVYAHWAQAVAEAVRADTSRG